VLLSIYSSQEKFKKKLLGANVGVIAEIPGMSVSKVRIRMVAPVGFWIR